MFNGPFPQLDGVEVEAFVGFVYRERAFGDPPARRRFADSQIVRRVPQRQLH